MQSTLLTCLTSVQRKHCLYDGESASGLLVVSGCVLVGWFVLLFLEFFLVFFSLILLCSLSTTMTWAHRPHGVRARGKKILPVHLQEHPSN